MNLRKAILVSLDRVHPHMLPEAALWSDVCSMLPRPTPISEVRKEISHLEQSGKVVGLIDDINETTKYAISITGRAALASA